MDLPQDIILYNILSRTPSKSLARFKCVSKHWNLVISNPEFMKSRSRRMILLPVLPFQAIDTYNSQDDSTTCYSTVELRHSPFECKQLSFVGTFSGIVFLVLKDYIKEHLILYNPLTQAFKQLPDPPFISLHPSDYSLFGFGYDDDDDELKIVKIRVDTVSPVVSRSCDVFGFKNGSWSSTPAKLIGNYEYFHSNSGTFVNGCLYWLAFNHNWEGILIVVLDLNEMVFSKIQVPSDDDGFATLGTLDGSLCVVCCKESDHGAEYRSWVMKKDGSRNSRWIYVLLMLDPCYRFCERWSLAFEMGILDDGKIVRFDCRRNKFVIFDLLKDSYKDVKTITSLSQVSTSKAIEYVESWVSPSDQCSSLI